MLQKTTTLPTLYSCDRKYAAKKLRENAMGFATFRTFFFRDISTFSQLFDLLSLGYLDFFTVQMTLLLFVFRKFCN